MYKINFKIETMGKSIKKNNDLTSKSSLLVKLLIYAKFLVGFNRIRIDPV